MSKKGKRWTAALLSAALALSAAPAVSQPDHAYAETGETVSAVIDSFDGYADDAALQAAWARWQDVPDAQQLTDYATRTLDAHGGSGGSAGMKIETVMDGAGWANMSRSIPEGGRDWSGYDGVTFWIDHDSGNADPLGLAVDLTSAGAYGMYSLKSGGTALLSDGQGGWTETAYSGSVLSIPDGFTGSVRLPFGEFAQAAWQCDSCSAPLADTSEMVGFQFGFNPADDNESAFTVDDIGLYRAERTLDDFGGYADDAALISTWNRWQDVPDAEQQSDYARRSVDPAGGRGGTAGMKIETVKDGAGWANVSRSIPEGSRDWSDYDGVTFWIRHDSGDAKALSLSIDLTSDGAYGMHSLRSSGIALLSDGQGGWTETAYSGGMLQVPDGFEGAVRLPFGEFAQAAWQCDSCSAPLTDTSEMVGFQFGFSPVDYGASVFTVDDIGLYAVSSRTGGSGGGSGPEGPTTRPAPPAWASADGTFELNYAQAPIDNPLKGFLPFLDGGDPNDGAWRTELDQMPYSMEYFYIPLNDVMTGENRFDWTKLEENLDVIASRGHQSVLRFYLDYPNRPTGIPQYLLDAGLATHSYTDYDNGAKATSVSPDYDDPRLVKALDDFIAAFGERYDGDPRIGFIMVGLIGFWGEWHTYPHAEGADNWMPSEANQKRVLEDMDEAFDETKLVVRNPIASGELQTKAFDIGYHDDSFAYETLPVSEGGESWHFWGRVINANDTAFWQTRPMGGEMRPEIQIAMWDRDPPGTSDGEDYYKSLKYTHASWLIDHAVFKTPMSGQPLERAREGSRSLGYEYYVPAAYLDGSSGKVKVGVELENRGVAPFYYDWKVELAVRDGAGIQTVWSPDWKISGVLPNDPDKGIVNNKLLEAEDAPTLTNGDYEVLLRVVNPLSAAHDNAVRFRFANEEQGEDGWLSLGSVKVTNGKEPSPGVVPGPDSGAGGGDVPGADGRVSVAEDGTVPLAAFKAAVDAGVGEANAEHRVILQVAAGADADAVVLSAEALAYAKEKMPDGVLDVRTAEASYELPLDALDLAALGKKLAAQAGDLSLVVAIRAKPSDERVDTAAARQGLKLVGGVVEFKVLARAGGRETEVTDFGGAYVTRTIRLPSAVDAARATGVALDPATGALVFVPTVFKVEGEEAKAVLKRMGNSLYAVAVGAKTFDDLNGSSAKADIESLAAKQIVKGRTERLYAPEAPVSRAEFVALLVRALGLPAAEPAGAFADVREGAWYASAVEAAARVGLVRGAGEGKFRPADVITREEAAVMLAGAARIAGLSIGDAQSDLSKYADGDGVHPWARQAMSAALKSGMLKPATADRLSPGEELSREQAAVSLTAFLRQAGFIG